MNISHLPFRRLRWIHGAALLVLLAVWFSVPAPARARPQAAGPVLLESTPSPDAVLGATPLEVELRFDRALVERGTWISVTNEAGVRHDLDDMHIDDDSRFSLRISLGALPDGRYYVQYNAASLGGSTVTAGRYEFVVDLPDPRLEMRAPASGSWYERAEVPLEFSVQYVDFGAYENRIRVYVDGGLYDELRSGEGAVEGLAPGVHQIEAVLARFEDEELAETRRTAYVAVAEPPAETVQFEPPWQTWFDVPDSLRTALVDWPWTVALTLGLLALGVLLGVFAGRTGPEADT